SKATIGNAIASAPAATCSLGEPGAQPTDYCYGGGNSAGAALAAYSDEPVRRPIPDPGSETLPHSSRSRRIVCVFSGVSRSIETMKTLPCNDILSGRAPSDTPVTLRGWVRTRRDSKAGISFIHVSDGSCFHPVQVVTEYAAELRERSSASDRRLRGRSDRHDRALAREGPAVRDAGERHQGD